jgi:cytoskeletal protein CcmA (bactofilin family)
MNEIIESDINIISEGTRLEGNIIFDNVSRIHGTLKGEIISKDGSTLILSQTGVIEGNVSGDSIIIDGYVNGEVSAKTKIVISSTGRLIGNAKTPSLEVEFGAYFDGQCNMPLKAVATSKTLTQEL